MGQIDDDSRYRTRLVPSVCRPVVVGIPGSAVVQDEAARDDRNLVTPDRRRLLAWRAPCVPDATVAGWRIVPRRDIEATRSDDHPSGHPRLFGDDHGTGTQT